MANLEYSTAARRREPIPFTLDGDHYEFNPPKKADMVLKVIHEDEPDIKALFDWFEEGLSAEDGETIEARLRDPEDDLDVDLLVEIIKDLLGKVSGRPTKRSSGSRRTR